MDSLSYATKARKYVRGIVRGLLSRSVAGFIAVTYNFSSQVETASQQAPKEAHGFELMREQFVPEYNSNVLLYRHKKTGMGPCATSTWSIGVTAGMIEYWKGFPVLN
jgi:hypothetical protein